MGENWQAGDLALCVERVPWRGMFTHHELPDGPLCGRIYIVTDIRCEDFLVFAQWAPAGFDEANFRKIHPHQPDAEDAETIRLMSREPAPTLADRDERELALDGFLDAAHRLRGRVVGEEG